jgi:hypothetical protein
MEGTVSSSSLWQTSDTELVCALTAAETRLRQAHSEMLALLAEVEIRGVATKLGYSHTAALLLHILRISRAEARNRLGQVEELFSTITPTGSVIEASLPRTAEALARGDIGVEQVDVIRKTLKGLSDLEPEKRVLAESAMLEQAAEDDPNALARFGTGVRDLVDPDGSPPPDPDPQRPPRVFRRNTRRDGTMEFQGYVPAEDAHLVEALIGPREKFRDSNDTRGCAERAGDAFVEVLKMAANCPDSPTRNGYKTEVALTVSVETLAKAKADAVLNLGDTFMTARDIRRMLCDAHVLPAVMGTDSKPLDVAVPSYVVPAHIRRGLVLRDKGCAFPGCAKPANVSDSHHIRQWLQGGPTQLDNLVLLCPHHHKLVHHSDWEIKVVNGFPEFTPPAYVDPLRRPRTNAIRRPRLPATA